jgi:hypothetical protein
MPSDNLPSNLFSKMLAEKLEGKELDTTKIQSLVSDDKTRNLNYEVLYKFLESAVEEFILVNHGNPLADDFRNKVFNKLSDVLNLLYGKSIDEKDKN